MINQHDIADFNLSDGLTPHQVKKLNYNFQNVFADIRSLTDKAKRPVESLRIGTVTMVASDEPASVENSGSRNNVVLDFRIPTGVEPKITDAQVDSVLADEAPTGNRVLSLTGLSRFWAGVKDAISAVSSSMVTGVKGDAESSYRRGNVNLAPADIGAAPASHTHDADDTVSGVFAVARIPNLNASKITAGTLALARGGTASDNTARAINTVFAGPASGSAGNASWRKLAAADIPNLAASKITSGTFDVDRIPDLPASQITSGTLNINRIPTITPAKGGTGRTSAQLALKTIFSGTSAGDGDTIGTNTDIFDYRVFLVKLNNVSTYLIGYRSGSTSSAGTLFAGNNEFQETAGGDKSAGCKISVSTAGLCKVVAAGYHKLQNNTAITTTSSKVTGIWGLY